MTIIIKPRLGIGDLLIIKMIYKSKKIDKIIISNDLVKCYRLEPEKYLNFLYIFIKNLFNNPEIIYEDTCDSLLELDNYKFNNSYLFDQL